tara:strand:+ start:156 stop:806 length:651 start_codon:yes stop_codon:yes gene_type:complete
MFNLFSNSIIQHLGYLVTFLAISIKDVLWLRIVLAVAQILAGIYQWIEGRIDIVLWNMIFTLINFYHIFQILNERKPIKIPEDIQDLYNSIFYNFSSKEFINFWSLGEIVSKSNKQIIKEGQKQRHLLLILSGKVQVKKNNKLINVLARGNFVAEMSLISNETASADIFVEENVKFIIWDQARLRYFEKINKDLWIKLHNILSKDLIKKIKVFSTD